MVLMWASTVAHLSKFTEGTMPRLNPVSRWAIMSLWTSGANHVWCEFCSLSTSIALVGSAADGNPAHLYGKGDMGSHCTARFYCEPKNSVNKVLNLCSWGAGIVLHALNLSTVRWVWQRQADFCDFKAIESPHSQSCTGRSCVKQTNKQMMYVYVKNKSMLTVPKLRFWKRTFPRSRETMEEMLCGRTVKG